MSRRFPSTSCATSLVTICGRQLVGLHAPKHSDDDRVSGDRRNAGNLGTALAANVLFPAVDCGDLVRCAVDYSAIVADILFPAADCGNLVEDTHAVGAPHASGARVTRDHEGHNPHHAVVEHLPGADGTLRAFDLDLQPYPPAATGSARRLGTREREGVTVSCGRRVADRCADAITKRLSPVPSSDCSCTPILVLVRCGQGTYNSRDRKSFFCQPQLHRHYP